MKDFLKEIRAYALKNAIDFGKADQGKMLPKLFQHGLDKKDIKNVMPIIVQVCKEVNSLQKSNQQKEFEKYKSLVKEREEKERVLPELNNVSKNMVFRLAPYPSGALHLGNTKTYLLNVIYAEKYKAKILFVMDDTIGSEEKKLVPESYNLLEEAFQWLSVKYEKPVIYKSDRLEIYYEHGEKLIEKNKAYVCKCHQEILRENRINGLECSCRNLSLNEQKKRWKEMPSLQKGEAVLRLKTDMKHQNPAFRDRVLFKISDRPHPRVGIKYKVWPTLEMSWAVDDHILGITHILRGNDLMIETDMEKYIWDIFNWKRPETIHAGMVRIKGMGAKLSKSKAQKEVLSGEFTGWDDPRTWSIQSLRRRGIRPEAIRAFVEEIGLNKQDIIIPIEALYAHNRRLIDLESNRFSFVHDPVEIIVSNIPKVAEIEIPVHPDKRSETRKIALGKKIFISNEDVQNLKGKEIRLLHLFNIDLGKSETKGAVTAKYTSTENKPITKINWVSNGVKTRVLMPDGKWIEGLAEEAISKLKVGEMIQFERNFFCRFDGKHEGIYEFWFAHK